jgi:NAD(P)H-hydrate epimerase
MFVRKCPVPIAIDADGLNALGKDFKAPNGNIVLTPHAKEFERLGGNRENVPDGARNLGCTVLFKGRIDIISNGDHTKFNNTGCAGMTGAGTGDVLAGITAALLSKGMSAFDAACLAAYISGKAGELAFAEKSYGMIATDVIDRIPDVLREGLKR